MIKLRIGRVGGIDITKPNPLEIAALVLVLAFFLALVLISR